MKSKSTGSYYTPEKLAKFILHHVFTRFEGKPHLRVLEPSCGDGVFLESLNEYNQNIVVDAVEKNSAAIKKAQKRNRKKNIKIRYIKANFLKQKFGTDYDLVVGNPPYIGRKLLAKYELEACSKIHSDGGLSANSIRNIWPAFVIKSSQLINEQGVLAMVLPGELLQVSYAGEIRDYLENNFQSVELLSFESLVFPALGQDVVVLFAYKTSQSRGLRYARVKDIDSLNTSLTFRTRVAPSRTKWTSLVLTDDDLEFLFKVSENFKKISSYCSSSPGVVTGANDFFIINKTIVDRYKLSQYAKSILQKSTYVGNEVFFDKDQFGRLEKSDKPSFLLDLGDNSLESLPIEVQEYLRLGKRRKIHTGYKCKNRTPWYNIPVVWAPVGMFFKRSHIFPKILRNDANVLVTDTAYRIIPHDGYNIESIIYSFYNSLTLAFSELNGRYYGGGVLELTPSEFQGLPIPYQNITPDAFKMFASRFHASDDLSALVNENDKFLLSSMSGIDIERLQRIRKELLLHRLRSVSQKV